ncbi:O-antigen ligase family protein [Silvibacterium acidisoli]|uniref:O-antigen ligase family protein n=1 Tax=Acidobacteriaceae bacterium ZG23-2 TaxID=2883246 RepID=UPI00406D3186
MIYSDERAIPSLTYLVVIGFLVLNAQMWEEAGWAIAFAYASARMLTRRSELGLPYPVIRLLIAPMLIFTVGLPGFYRNDLNEFLKDCWYFTSPMVYIVFGYLVAERIGTMKRLISLFTIGGLAVSLQMLFRVYSNSASLLAANSAENYRHFTGVGAGQAMIPIVLIIFARKTGLDIGWLDRSKALRYTVFVVGTLAIILALSRTLMAVLLVGVLITVPLKKLGRWGVVGAIAVGLAMLAPQLWRLSTPAATQSFFEKSMNTGHEVELQSYDTMAEINDNWRGFEGYKAFEAYNDFSWPEKIIGGGFGTLVNIGFSMNLGGPEEMQELPVLHNGYLYLLVKTGVLGIVIFFAYLVYLTRLGVPQTRYGTAEVKMSGYVLIWSVITFLMTQGVITGIYNKGVLAPNLTLLGAAAALAYRRQVEEEAVFQARQPQILYPRFPGEALP